MEKKNIFDTKTEELKLINMEIERISSGENLFENTKCSLCYLIPGFPFRSNCCENIICNSCTFSWRNKNHKECPICRNEKFSSNELNRFERNIYYSIKYYCNFKSKGCKIKDLLIEQIIPHEKICEFNENISIECLKCKETYMKNEEEKHDCINSLLEKNKKLLEKIEEIKLNNNENTTITNNFIEKDFSYLEKTLKYKYKYFFNSIFT